MNQVIDVLRALKSRRNNRGRCINLLFFLNFNAVIGFLSHVRVKVHLNLLLKVLRIIKHRLFNSRVNIATLIDLRLVDRFVAEFFRWLHFNRFYVLLRLHQTEQGKILYQRIQTQPRRVVSVLLEQSHLELTVGALERNLSESYFIVDFIFGGLGVLYLDDLVETRATERVAAVQHAFSLGQEKEEMTYSGTRVAESQSFKHMGHSIWR